MDIDCVPDVDPMAHPSFDLPIGDVGKRLFYVSDHFVDCQGSRQLFAADSDFRGGFEPTRIFAPCDRSAFTPYIDDADRFVTTLMEPIGIRHLTTHSGGERCFRRRRGVVWSRHVVKKHHFRSVESS